MKRIVYLAAVILALAACKKEPQVQKVSVTGITLNPTSISLNEGQSVTLTATVSPSDATNKVVLWSTDNPSAATVSDGKVSALKAGNATITAKSDDGGFTATCLVTVTVPVVLVSGITIEPTSLSLYAGTTAALTVTVTPDNASNKTLVWTSSKNGVATVSDGTISAVSQGETTITATAVDGSGVKAQCSVTVIPFPAGAVDLGIVMKREDGTYYNLYWAKSNMSGNALATNPEEYGDCIAWGELGKKGLYDWTNYKFRTSGDVPSNIVLSKYITDSSYGSVDNKTVLDSEDDVAHVKLGGNWRMPTDAEWTELQKQCTWTWTDNYNGTGVHGRIVKAPNGNSIFLPAAGYSYYNERTEDDSHGYYWSSSLNTGDPACALSIVFTSSEVGRKTGNQRFYGCSVRPVTE